jgi:glycerophosphoryl diester phosphodiesterase
MIVYGHRGARGEAPENTIAGALHAVSRGVRHLEIDLRLSSDGQLVVIHDTGLKRTTGSRGKVSKHGVGELAKMDARSGGTPWPNKRHTGIPSLSALVKAVPEIKLWQLELKAGGKRYNAALADAVVAWLNEHTPQRGASPYIVTSSEPKLLTEIKRQRPKQATGFVSTTTDPSAVLAACECDYLIAQWTTLRSAAQVWQLQKTGVHISAWTVNDASVIENLYQLGIDSVITDYPSMALPLIAKLKRLGVRPYI